MKIRHVIILAGCASLWGQTPLSLADAVQAGLQHHPALEVSAANQEAAQSRVREAQAGRLPKLSYSEAFQRSDNPVFVFGSLLDQRQFTEDNFNLGQLNNPNFINNFQSQIRADQTVYDFGSTKWQVRSAELGTEIAGQDDRRARMGIIAGVASAYFGAILGQERLAVAEEAVRSAESDLQRAENIRAAGMSTDADVLSVRVHLADMKEREIQARYALDVSSAALNDAVGLPLETQHQLSTALAPARLTSADLGALDQVSLQGPGPRQASLAVQTAEAQSSAARSALLPRITVHGVFEADRQTFATRGGANWFFGASLDWNLFNGFADQSRRDETAHLAAAARARQKRTESATRLEVRRAYAAWKGAEEQIGVAAAAVSQAEESLRITRNRYEAGLITVTELLRNETATLETKTRHLEAIYAQRVAATQLELAAGTLAGDSDALK
ncbi:MAG TPA: TolC family protein [Bryobacteraceae bacterium]|nr:TolC family protein [Bryobacteraceae bacterium]